MSKRQYRRYTKRLETEFSAGGLTYRGISSDLSAKGLFIRTQHGFVPGTRISINLRLPDGTISSMKGIVRRTVKTPLNLVKNGMGIELTQIDEAYRTFLVQELAGDEIIKGSDHRPAPAGAAEEEPKIVACPSCGVKNRVRGERLHLRPKCGKCGALLVLFFLCPVHCA